MKEDHQYPNFCHILYIDYWFWPLLPKIKYKDYGMKTLIVTILVFAASVSHADYQCPKDGTLVSYAQCLIDKQKLPIQARAVQRCNDRGWCQLKYSAASCDDEIKRRAIDALFGEVLRSSTHSVRVTSFDCIVK